MAKIKLEENNIVVYYSEMGAGIYDSAKNYKIDLTNKRHFLLKPDGNIEITWCLTQGEEVAMVENLIKDCSFRIESCYNVIHSYKKEGNIPQVEKHEIHLENTKRILDFLKKYNS